MPNESFRFLKNEFPDDARPREAIDACRKWVQTDVFMMADIRKVSLAAHAAAHEAKQNSASCFAARAAGQAVATAHVAQHAFGGAYYALKAIVAADPSCAETRVAEEHSWQIQHIPTEIRQEIVKRLIVEKRKKGVFVKVQKDKDF